MSADAMVVPMGEVRLDGRLDRMDGTWTGTKVAGQIERGTVGDAGPMTIIIPASTVMPMDLSSAVGMLVPYTGARPEYRGPKEPVADVFWYETFMERLTKDFGKRRSDSC
jgi:hypothetical protein